MNLTTRHKPMAAFSIISLADIVLLLLIYFLLTSTYVVSQGIKVRLPKAEAERVQEVQNIVVSITREGKIFLNNRPVTIQELTPKIHQLLKERPGASIVLMADEDVRIQEAVNVLEASAKAGGRKLIIATRER